MPTDYNYKKTNSNSKSQSDRYRCHNKYVFCYLEDKRFENTSSSSVFGPDCSSRHPASPHITCQIET